MERYTINTLPVNPTEDFQDMRCTSAPSRIEFLWCAIKSNILQNATTIGKVALILVLIGIIVMLVAGRPWKALTLLAVLTLAYGKFLWNINKLYSNLHSSD